jgi:hypothetical protein
MATDILKRKSLEIMGYLVRGEYDSAVSACVNSRLTAEGLHNVIANYGRTLTFPPANAYENLDAVRVSKASNPTWTVDLPLWTIEEGRSDLTLQLTIFIVGENINAEIDDLHVL